MRVKLIAFCCQFLTQRYKVINFSIEYEHDVFLIIVERLIGPLRQVDDAQSPEPKCHLVISMNASTVWTPVNNHIHHIFNYFFMIKWSSAIYITDKTTH